MKTPSSYLRGVLERTNSTTVFLIQPASEQSKAKSDPGLFFVDDHPQNLVTLTARRNFGRRANSWRGGAKGRARYFLTRLQAEPDRPS